MNISAPFIRRPIATALLMVGLLVAGLVAYPHLAGRGSAERQLSDLQGDRAAARCRSADDGILGRIAARAAVRRDPRPDANDVVQRARLYADHAPVRSRPAVRRRGQRHACRRSTRRAPICRRTCPYPPTIRKVNPADTPILVLGLTSDSAAAHDGRRLCREYPAAEDLADTGRRPGRHRRPAEAGGPRAGRSAGAAARGINLEDVRAVLGQANVDLPKGTLNSPRQTFTLNTNDQLLQAGQIRRSHHRLS